jgi:hypothetical protein
MANVLSSRASVRILRLRRTMFAPFFLGAGLTIGTAAWAQTIPSATGIIPAGGLPTHVVAQILPQVSLPPLAMYLMAPGLLRDLYVDALPGVRSTASTGCICAPSPRRTCSINIDDLDAPRN